MSGPLEKRFPEELQLLKMLFGNEQVVTSLPRMNALFQFTEKKWLEYIKKIPGGQIRHLLIAEAPPWSLDGPPQYILDPASKSRSLLPALKKAFLSPGRNLSTKQCLEVFAHQHFLVTDSLPFSMNTRRKEAILFIDVL